MLDELVVIVPSRGRPENIEALMEAWRSTGAQAQLLVVIDADDPRFSDYIELHNNQYPQLETMIVGSGLRMAGALNVAAREMAKVYRYVGFMGDDHRPRTYEWDLYIEGYLSGHWNDPCIVYGNDLFQGKNLPTAVFMTSSIINTLGWMALPGAWHLYLDDVWKELGERAQCLYYLEDVVIEHLHPVAQKADWDEGYEQNNSETTYAHDNEVYLDWHYGSSSADIAKILALKETV